VQQWWLTAPQRATLSFQGAVVASHPDLFNYAGCTASAQNFVKDNTKVYPNPFGNVLQIESETGFTQLELCDIAGKQILNQVFVNQINTANLAQGMYLLRLTTEKGEVVVKKVVKE
ncbi:MAG TPA: T9SS type A sorting domain-containing protein, partial [Flavobacterium sp.]|uniref:T9SS type A sorting domain-containing protein n=1 Tax=Flavobacterium sp. TaxID=239 RepID=UPI002CCB551C